MATKEERKWRKHNQQKRISRGSSYPCNKVDKSKSAKRKRLFVIKRRRSNMTDEDDLIEYKKVNAPRRPVLSKIQIKVLKWKKPGSAPKVSTFKKRTRIHYPSLRFASDDNVPCVKTFACLWNCGTHKLVLVYQFSYDLLLLSRLTFVQCAMRFRQIKPYLSNDDFYTQHFPFVEISLSHSWRFSTKTILRSELIENPPLLPRVRRLFFASSSSLVETFFAFLTHGSIPSRRYQRSLI